MTFTAAVVAAVDTAALPGAALPGTALAGAVLAGAALPGAVLAGAVLAGAALPGAALAGTAAATAPQPSTTPARAAATRAVFGRVPYVVVANARMAAPRPRRAEGAATAVITDHAGGAEWVSTSAPSAPWLTRQPGETYSQ
ncbi:MAG: pentapeptide repeat-containing protein [Streptosporangiaceae bacterium]|nr:pentapeptide repeat-containing protein [Streptosporangiaceae bacterium]MBV9855899.1 pentapeptide repeat-containing protein [Streptosporangiaceae bacterium]